MTASFLFGEMTAEHALREHKYWCDRAHEIRHGTLGVDSETYRAALQMAYRWLGRFDILRQNEASK